MTKKEQRREEWIARVADYQASGQTMKAWCAANHTSKDQLRYWLRTLKNRPSSSAAEPAARFVPLSICESSTVASSPTLFVHVGTARIELQAGFDAQLLRQVVAALNAPC